MALVGIISDTHGNLDEAACDLLADCDYIIHAGDIGGPEILDELKKIAPLTAVLGNNDLPDYGDDVKESAELVIGGVRFFITHCPPKAQASLFGSPGFEPGDPVPDIYIHGHTHVPLITIGQNAYPAHILLCPGSVSRPRKRSPRCIAKVRVNGRRVVGADIISLEGNVVFSMGKGTKRK